MPFSSCEGRRVKGMSCPVLLRGTQFLVGRACAGTVGERAFARCVPCPVAGGDGLV